MSWGKATSLGVGWKERRHSLTEATEVKSCSIVIFLKEEKISIFLGEEEPVEKDY